MKACKNCEELKEEVTRLQNRNNHLEAYYHRAYKAYESLCQDVVDFISSTNNLPASSIWGGRVIAALAKASKLYHGEN